jgi:hypothetical protein
VNAEFSTDDRPVHPVRIVAPVAAAEAAAPPLVQHIVAVILGVQAGNAAERTS